MTDDPLEVCPVCGNEVRRVINSVGVVFKGKGFYVTDNQKSATLPSSGGGEATKSSDAGTSTDAKPTDAKKKPETSKTVDSSS
jgi:predicted nucleic acid-binding Zn ribbon protein